MSLSWLAGTTALVSVSLPLALAVGDGEPAPVTRVDRIPAHRTTVERDVVHPAVTGTRSVPAYETVKVPVLETRCVPVYETRDVPTYATREVKDVEVRGVPVYGPVEVPVYEARRRPVSLAFTNPFTCRPVRWHLWDRCEQVECGRRTEQAVVGWSSESVPVTRTERYVAGTETTRALVAYRSACVAVGEREERRCVGWKTESYEVEPAWTEKVRESSDVPEEAVTVVVEGDADDAEPLDGTVRVLTEAQFRRERDAASPPSSEPPAEAAPKTPRVPTPAEGDPMPEPTSSAPESAPEASRPADAPGAAPKMPEPGSASPSAKP